VDARARERVHAHACMYSYLSSMQSAKAILCCHLWPVRRYHIFSTLTDKRQDFGKEFIQHKILF
jgi:hypothetical protein